MPNFNTKISVICPRCKQERIARSDVVRKAEREGRELFCKPCRNQTRFENKPHPLKGTGIKNDPILNRTRESYYKAKQRAKMGKKHHACYENVDFRFASFDEFLQEVGPRPEGCTLDRIDPLGHYEKGNIRWATIRQQAENRLPRNYWTSNQR